MESSMSSILLKSLKSSITAGNLEDLREAFTKCQSNGVDPFQEKSPSLFHVASMTRDCSLGILEELITQFRRLSKKSSRKGSGLIAFLRDTLTPEEGYTALHCACKYNKLDYVYVFVKELRFYGIEPLKLNSCAVARNVFTPFEVACKYECHKVALFLLQKCGGIYDDFSSGLVIMFGKNGGKELIKKVCSDHKVNVKTLNSLLCQKRPDIVKFCMEEKLCKQKGKQLMQMAVSQGETDLINYLLKLDDRKIYTTPDKGGVNLMHIACAECQVDSIKCLISDGCAETMVAAKNNKGDSPFSIAIKKGFESILLLLEKELKLTELQMYCIVTESEDSVVCKVTALAFLIGADIHYDSVFRYACQNGNLSIINTFLHEYSSKINLKTCDTNGDTAVHLFVQQVYIISKKVKAIEASNKAAGKPLKRTKMHRKLESISSTFEKMMKHSTFNPTILNARNESAIFICLTKFNYEVAHLTLNVYSLLDVATKHYLADISKDVLRIVMHYCQYSYYVPRKRQEEYDKKPADSFVALIEKLTSQRMFDPNVVDYNGNTCLHYAASSLCAQLVEHFLSLPNISICRKNSSNKTPLECVPLSYRVSKLVVFCDIYSKFIKKGVSVDLKPVDKEGSTLLHLACAAKSASLLSLLTSLSSFQSIINKRNERGKAPLHLLCSRAKRFVSVKCFEILLRFNEIDVNILSVSGKTPLSILTSHINSRKPIMYEGIKKSILLLKKHRSFKPELYTSLDYLRTWCQVDDIDLFKKVLNDNKHLDLINSVNYYSQNLLHIACLNFSSEVLKFLLTFENSSVPFLNEDYFGNTPLTSLCWRVYTSNDLFIQDHDAVLATLSLLTKHESINCIFSEVRLWLGLLFFRLVTFFRHRILTEKLIVELFTLLSVDPDVRNCLASIPSDLLLHEVKALEPLLRNLHSANPKNPIHILLSNSSNHVGWPIINFCVNGNTLLHLACKVVNKDAVSALLSEAKVSVNRVNDDGQTCLHILIERNDSFCKAPPNDFLEIFNLLKSCSLFGIKDREGNTCLHLACKTSLSSIVEEIICTNPELVHIKNNEGDTPLHIACASYQLDAVKLLLEQNVDLRSVNAKQETVFHISILSKEIFSLLKTHSSYHDHILCMKDNNGSTCLHIAYKYYNSIIPLVPCSTILDMSLIHDIVNIANLKGQTMLHLCPWLIFNPHIKYDLNLAASDNDGNTPLLNFMEKLSQDSFDRPLLPNCSKYLNMWKQITKMPSFTTSMNHANNQQVTILYLACASFNDDLTLKESLIESMLAYETCKTAIVNEHHETPFHMLAFLNFKMFDKFCKVAKIDLNIVNHDGNTPLHIVCDSQLYADASDELLDSPIVDGESTSYDHANLMISNVAGNTTLHVACIYNCAYFVRVFSRLMPNINLPNKNGKTPFHCLYNKTNNEPAFSECWRILINHDSFNPNIQDNHGMTILHYECQKPEPDLALVECLLSHRAININLTNLRNQTCIALAEANDDCGAIKSRLLELLKNFNSSSNDLSALCQFMSLYHGLYDCHNASDCYSILKATSLVNEECNAALYLACQAVCPKAISILLLRCRKSISTCPVKDSKQTPLHVLALGIKQQADIVVQGYPNHLLRLREKDLSFVRGKVKSLSKHDWRILLQCGINKQDELGNTALHYVCEAQSVTMLRVLTSDISCKFDIRNNAGKLPITVAQESGNRSFYLRFLIKYFERQGNEGVADYYRAVLEDGATIPMTPVKCILTGPPGAGKTTLKQRLLGEKFTETTSTGVSDSPQVIAVRNVSTEQVSLSSSSDNMKWTPVDCRDQIEALLETVSSHAHDAIMKKTSLSVSDILPDADFVASTGTSKPTKPSSTYSQVLLPFKSSFPQWQQNKEKSKAKIYRPKNLEKQLKELRFLANFVPAKKSKNDPHKFTVSDLEKNPFVRIIDTGGQPELHELLPAFVTGPAINLIVFNLQLPLQEQFRIYCRSESDGDSVAYESCINHEDMILRSLSSIACLGYGSHILSNEFHVLHSATKFADPAAFLIGSHKDEVDDEKIGAINEHLTSLINIEKCDSDLNEIVQPYSGSCILYPINGQDEHSEEIGILRQHIFQAIEKQFKPVEVPLTWLILSIKLQLQVMIEKKSVIEFDECLKIARKCGFEDADQLKRALWFFHNVMGTVMYFQHISELESKVILDLQAIFDCITKLITSCFIYETIPKRAEEEFTKRGIFTLKSLEKAFKLAKNKYLFSAQEIIALLKYLHAIVAIEEGKYFMPTSLSPTDLSDLHQDTSIPPPLLISFDCGYTPVGIFGSLVTRLLSDANIKCRLDDRSQQYRNKIKLVAGSWRDEITLISRAKFLEVILKRMNPKASSSLADIRMAIDEGIKAVTESFHYKSKAKHFFGFACSCELLPQHPAICEDIETKSIRCPQTNDHVVMPLNDAQLAWFDIQQEHVEGLPNLPSDLLQKTLGIDDLDDVEDALTDLIEWKKLGLKLGLMCPTLDKIEVNKLNKVDDCKMEMLACWLRKQDKVKSKNGPSWEQLIEVLRAMKKSDIVENVIRVLHDINKSVQP